MSQAVGDFTSELGRRLAGVLREQFARYGLEVRHAELLAHALIGSVHQVSAWWLSGRDAAGREIERGQLTELLVRLLWSGLPSVGIEEPADARG